LSIKECKSAKLKRRDWQNAQRKNVSPARLRRTRAGEEKSGQGEKVPGWDGRVYSPPFLE
jgi:hypothetical protein